MKEIADKFQFEPKKPKRNPQKLLAHIIKDLESCKPKSYCNISEKLYTINMLEPKPKIQTFLDHYKVIF